MRLEEHRGKLTLAAVGSIVAILVGGTHLWMAGRTVAKERREDVSRQNGRLFDLEVRVCALEGGKWRNGECRQRRR